MGSQRPTPTSPLRSVGRNGFTSVEKEGGGQGFPRGKLLLVYHNCAPLIRLITLLQLTLIREVAKTPDYPFKECITLPWVVM